LLRIALFAPALPGSGVSNGIVTYTGIMRTALGRLGHEIMVLAGDQIEYPDGRVAAVPESNPLVRRLRQYLESRQPDDGSSIWIRLRILDAFRAARRAGAQLFEIEESYGWAARLVGRGAAIVTRLHGPHVFGREPIETAAEKSMGDLREAAELASLIEVQAVTCPSQRLLDAMIARHGLKLPLARAIPNPIPVAPRSDSWSPDRANSDQILCVGRFDLRKGADIVVHAFVQALQSRPSIQLVMAGTDPGLAQPDGSVIHFGDFVARDVPLEARSRISFLGPQPPKRIAELRLQSAFTIVGSRFENFPYSIAEAMAVGMPVLASDSFGNGEMIRDRLDGRLVPVGDVPAMAQAMVELVSDSNRLGEMGRSAQARAADWLSPERIARETVSLYREAMLRA
jgi:glycosyltransferase involved in cell wall biosynthesis